MAPSASRAATSGCASPASPLRPRTRRAAAQLATYKDPASDLSDDSSEGRNHFTVRKARRKGRGIQEDIEELQTEPTLMKARSTKATTKEQDELDAQLGFKDIVIDGNDQNEQGGSHDFAGRVTKNAVSSLTLKRKRGGDRRLSAETVVTRESLDVDDSTRQEEDSPEIEPEQNWGTDGQIDYHAQFEQILVGNDMSKPLALMRQIVLEKLTGRRRVGLVGLDEEYKKIHQLMEQTVTAGEGNSLLVIGARGSGKTTLLESVIANLSVNHRQDFHIVRLNGFIHTDDKLALRETWRQLGREMEVDDDAGGKMSNYADTLSSLLALLSHPSDTIGPSSPQASPKDQQSNTTKSILFILDEFDLFTNHPRQTLLYNLFDIAQARKAPIAVIGLTTRINVVESLEKRVKSRFSHRYVHLSLANTPSAFWQMCLTGLTISTSDISSLPQSSQAIMTTPPARSLRTTWSSFLTSLYVSTPPFTNHILTIYHTTKSVPTAFSTFLLPIAQQLHPLHLKTFTFLPNPTTNPNLQTLSLPPTSKLSLLPSLPTLALHLLIASTRLTLLLSLPHLNFAIAYDEYSNLCLSSRHSSTTNTLSSSTQLTPSLHPNATRLYPVSIALTAWEHLITAELLLPVFGAATGVGLARGSGGGTGSSDVGRAGRMYRVDVALEEIAESLEKSQMTGGVARWCREI